MATVDQDGLTGSHGGASTGPGVTRLGSRSWDSSEGEVGQGAKTGSGNRTQAQLLVLGDEVRAWF